VDIVTHALLGAAGGLGMARTREYAKAAAVAGAAGALFPDIDVLISSSTDPLLALEFHRHFTHSFLFAPIAALLVSGPIWLVLKQRAPLGYLYCAALIGVISHILLDSATSYGVQLLWPFSERRFALSIVAVIDPIVTIALLIGIVTALRRNAAARARIAIAAAAIYLGVGWMQQQRAEHAVERAATARGHTITRHEVKPTMANLLLWRSIYASGDAFVVDAVRVGLGTTIYTGGASKRVQPIDLVPPLTLNSVQANDVLRFARVSDGWLARHPARQNVIGDLRYSMLPDSRRPLWGIEAHAEREQHHVNFVTFRDFGPQERQRFIAMLRGVPPDQPPTAKSPRKAR
jgi:inner membrane protein